MILNSENKIHVHLLFVGMNSQSLSEIEQRMESVQVVGVTCLAINHPLLTNKNFDVCIMDEAGQITLPVWSFIFFYLYILLSASEFLNNSWSPFSSTILSWNPGFCVVFSLSSLMVLFYFYF
jgi:hypothetical protein